MSPLAADQQTVSTTQKVFVHADTSTFDNVTTTSAAHEPIMSDGMSRGLPQTAVQYLRTHARQVLVLPDVRR